MAAIAPIDVARLRTLTALARKVTTSQLLETLLPDDPHAREALSATSRFAHVGLLIFPQRLSDLSRQLARIGFRPHEVLPSVVVKGRLCVRYGLLPERTTVVLVRGEDAFGTQVEVFGVPAGQLDAAQRRSERRREHERHFAFEVHPWALARFGAVAEVLATAGFQPDGGGFNPHERATTVGRTVRYFARDDRADGKLRLELTWLGADRGADLSVNVDGARPGLSDVNLLTGEGRNPPPRSPVGG